MKIKIRIKYKRSKTVFNGKYYFGLKKEIYDQLFGKGKCKRKKITFDKLPIYKIYDECILHKPDYVFEFDHKDEGFFRNKKNFKLSRYNLIAKRNKDGILEPVGQEIKYK